MFNKFVNIPINIIAAGCVNLLCYLGEKECGSRVNILKIKSYLLF